MKQLFNCCLLAFIFTVSLTSCKKSDEPNRFPQNLKLNTVEKKSEIRLFINKQEVFDANLINDFINDGAASYNFNLHQKPMPSYFLTFIMEDTATMGVGDPPEKFSYTKKDSLFLFLSKSVHTYAAPIDENEFYKYVDPVVTPNPNGGYDHNEVAVGYGSYTDLKMILCGYKYSNGSNPTGQYDGLNKFTSTMNNEVNEEFIQQLGMNDTLAFQLFEWKFKPY
jgi:hypothetical protein